MGKTMKVIGFVGFKGSGKDTTAIPYIEQGYQKTSFAGVLKDVCAAIFGWDRQMLEGTDAESRLWREETDLWWAEKLVAHFNKWGQMSFDKTSMITFGFMQ
jgi:hypothetical protein